VIFEETLMAALRVAACNYWVQTSWQVMQRNRDCSWR